MRKNRTRDVETPLAMGTGLIALDVIVTADEASPPKLCTGGTCGNVLLALRFLGFDAAPVCRLQDDAAGSLILKELRGLGVSTAYVSAAEDGSTPVIVQTIRTPPGGIPIHTFSWRCPNCGARFPGYKPVLASEAESIAAAMPVPTVFFFDRVSRGAIMLASRAAELGAVVVFEPSGVGDLSLFREAWSVAHVVKYSHERLAELPDGFEFSESQVLQIETLGSDGLRYRARFGKRTATPWRMSAALKAPIVKDTAGAGDWCTAGLLHMLGRSGAEGFRRATPDEMERGVRFGQALAAWNCGYVGARGGMCHTTLQECLDQVRRILEGRGDETDRKPAAQKQSKVKHSWCSSCADVPVPTVERDLLSRRTTA
jgi:sugar/nucleoside kinase (ribokinase family)